MKKFILVTTEFGFNAYINIETNLTDKIENATEYIVGEDCEKSKLNYWSAFSGLNLKIKYIKN